MKKIYKDALEWSVLVALVLFCILPFALDRSFSPLKAHEKNEKSVFYGPSKVMKTIDLKEEKIYVCKSDKHLSLDTVKKGMLFWKPKQKPIVTDEEKTMTSKYFIETVSDSYTLAGVYGDAMDDKIKGIKLIVDARAEGKETEVRKLDVPLESDRFYAYFWNNQDKKYRIAAIQGIDAEGKVVVEKSFDEKDMYK